MSIPLATSTFVSSGPYTRFRFVCCWCDEVISNLTPALDDGVYNYGICSSCLQAELAKLGPDRSEVASGNAFDPRMSTEQLGV